MLPLDPSMNSRNCMKSGEQNAYFSENPKRDNT